MEFKQETFSMENEQFSSIGLKNFDNNVLYIYLLNWLQIMFIVLVPILNLCQSLLFNIVS